MTDVKADALAHSSEWADACFMAANWVTATLLIAVTGHLIVQGYDGLAVTLGFSGAAVLWAGFIWPLMVRDPENLASNEQPSVPRFLARQTKSQAVGALAATVMIGALAGLLAADFTVAETVLALGVGSRQPAIWMVMFAAVFGLAIALRQDHQLTAVGPLILGLAFAMVLAALMSLSANCGLGALIAVPELSDIANLELNLLERHVADPATFKPHTVPFLRTDALNFACSIISLSFGLALLATLPRREISWAITPSRAISRAVLIITALLVLLPPLAAAGKRALLSWSSGGIRATTLPDWTLPYRDIEALKICGSSSLDVAIIAKACGKGVGPQGLLRWQETVFSPESILPAAMTANGHSAVALGLTGLVLALTAWSTARIARLVMTTPPLTTAGGRRVVSVLVLVGAAALSLLHLAEAVKFVTTSAAITAAALGPAVIATALWPRVFGSRTVATAIATGASITLFLIVGTAAAPIELYTLMGALTSAPASVAKKLATLNDAWLAAAQGLTRDALLAQSEKIARDNLSWFGFKSQSAAILGAVSSAVVLLAGGLMGRGFKNPKNA